MSYLVHPKLRQAANHISNGGVLAYPTEGVWGLGADPFHFPAVEKILRLKKRPMSKGVILVAANMQQFQFILRHVSQEQLAILSASWPGPNTWLVPHNDEVPEWIHGGNSSVALRVSAHPLVSALCQMVGPIVSTSANPQGLPPALTGYRARCYFGNEVFYAPGQVHQNAKPSTIRDLITGQTVRA